MPRITHLSRRGDGVTWHGYARTSYTHRARASYFTSSTHRIARRGEYRHRIALNIVWRAWRGHQRLLAHRSSRGALCPHLHSLARHKRKMAASENKKKINGNISNISQRRKKKKNQAHGSGMRGGGKKAVMHIIFIMASSCGGGRAEIGGNLIFVAAAWLCAAALPGPHSYQIRRIWRMAASGKSWGGRQAGRGRGGDRAVGRDQRIQSV